MTGPGTATLHDYRGRHHQQPTPPPTPPRTAPKLPATELLFEAAEYAGTTARRVEGEMTAHRALLAVAGPLSGEPEEHTAECMRMAEAWFTARFGPGALRAMTGASAAGALSACACDYLLALREA